MTGTQVLTTPSVVRDSPVEVDAGSRTDPNRWWARSFGGMFVGGGLAHLLLLSLHSAAYDTFANASYWPFITHAWRSVLVPDVYYLVPLLATFELAVGVVIVGRPFRLLGISAAAAFNAALVLFGWGFFIWSGPVLALLSVFALREMAERQRVRGADR